MKTKKKVIVTGGGSGIGKSICLYLSKKDYHVIIIGRNQNNIEEVARQLGGEYYVCDVSNHEQVSSTFNKIKKNHSVIDSLVNNAGISGPVAPIDEVNVDEFKTCLDINVMGTILCTKEISKLMKSQKHGSIINMSSLMGLKGYPMRSAYCASKFAIIGITESHARELGEFGIRVNAVCPGAVNGELMERVLAMRAQKENKTVEQITKENYTDVSSLKRWVEPEEVASVVEFLISENSSSLTGDRLKVDCGRF